MRLFLAALASSCILTALPVRGEKTFPYKAHITADEVYVRSGPGQSYYPTDKLKTGQEVEVYRHDPGGWYAIRPPERSFSWVSGRFLKAGVDGLAVVTEDRVAARAGSRFSDIRDVIQVRLHKAEVVEVLEAKKTGTGSDRRTWYKIAPPSGEFRWVFGKYVDPDYPHDGLRETSVAQGGVSRADTTGMEVAEPSPPVAVTPARRRPPGEPPVVIVRPAADFARQTSEPEQPAYQPVSPRQISPEEYRAELEQTDMQLSAMVVEEPTVWAFDEMRTRAEELLSQAETALERGRARVLVNKIVRFEDIRRRYDRINLVRRQNERSKRRFADLGRINRDTRRKPVSDGRFDGVGELIRVVSPKLGAPRYALVDRWGDVRCYVSPAPGVNLRHYMGRRVGINGTRGYMPEQRAHHLMAGHVSVLDARMR